MKKMSGGSETLGGIALVKLYGIKVIAGFIAVILGFAVLWPKTAKEGVLRIGCTVAGSMLGGETALQIVYNLIAWYPKGDEAKMLIYVAVGLPAWWIIGGFVFWFDKRKDKDLQEMIRDVKS
jgi:hypothetical protein